MYSEVVPLHNHSGPELSAHTSFPNGRKYEFVTNVAVLDTLSQYYLLFVYSLTFSSEIDYKHVPFKQESTATFLALTSTPACVCSTCFVNEYKVIS